MANRVLLIQSDMRPAQPLARYFKQRGDEVWQAWDLGQAQALVQQVKPHLVFFDLHFPSNEWWVFLRNLRQFHPQTKIIMTNKYPDLQRELKAREQGVQVFLRQPFSQRWIEEALRRVYEQTQPRPAQAPLPPRTIQVRVPVRVKIILPYLVLALFFALASAYVVSRILMESSQSRFLNQLYATGKQAQDWFVQEEDRLLGTLRQVANTDGVAAALQQGDAESLRVLVLPVAVNAREEEITLLNLSGESVLTLFATPGSAGASYESSRGNTTYGTWAFVQRTLRGETDELGDKFAGVGEGPLGKTFYVSGPVFNAEGVQVGVVLVGKTLSSIAREVSEDTLSAATFYDLNGQVLASSLFSAGLSFPISGEVVQQVLSVQNQSSLTRDLTLSSLDYTEVLGPWEVRGGSDLGVVGISLAKAFLIRTSRATQVQIFSLVLAGILLVILVGLGLANLFTRPVLRLLEASAEVAKGNLEVKVDAEGNDELAVLSQAFNSMVAGLQEGSIYRDLLGRTVSPEVREQLRQTFTSGNLRLEGQEAVATILMTDIRGFTSLSEKVDPATVFQWLNEYFEHIVPVITAYGGVVNKFDGDAVLAFFGILPRLVSPKQSALSACQAAVEILEAIEQFNLQRRARGEPQLITGIGVHTGVVMAGGLGTSDRLHYTVIGDTVNTAQRIEALTRELFDGSAGLISEATYLALAEHREKFQLRSMGEQSVKGKSEKLSVYQLLPVRESGKWEAML